MPTVCKHAINLLIQLVHHTFQPAVTLLATMLLLSGMIPGHGSIDTIRGLADMASSLLTLCNAAHFYLLPDDMSATMALSD
jgi:hypothetical protein